MLNFIINSYHNYDTLESLFLLLSLDHYKLPLLVLTLFATQRKHPDPVEIATLLFFTSTSY